MSDERDNGICQLALTSMASKKKKRHCQREVRLSDSSAKEYLLVEFLPHSVAISFA